VTLDDVKYHTAKQVNDAFGHLNYTDMGRSATMQRINRIFLLAPDFLEARARQAGHGVSGLMPGGWRIHGEQRMAFWTVATTAYIAARVLNQLLDNDPHWDWKMAFTVRNNGKDYTMRSVPEDMLRFLTGERQ